MAKNRQLIDEQIAVYEAEFGSAPELDALDTAEYSSELDALILKTAAGIRRLVLREDIETLSTASKEIAGRFEVLAGGTRITWPELDLDLYVPSLLEGVLGTKRWMQALGSEKEERCSP